MSVRLGIELSPNACRVVEIEASGRLDQLPRAATRVRSFARLARQGAEAQQRLSPFRGTSAVAVVWGLHADHRQVVVERHSFRRMRREAVAAMKSAGVDTRGKVADIFAVENSNGLPTRPVVAALAATPGLSIALQSLAAEGIRVDSIVTPALALMSLARIRGPLAAPERLEVYVALEQTVTALALVRNGLLIGATEIERGFQDDDGFGWQREHIASRLADDIERFVAEWGARPASLAQVCVCGGLPELRSMAVMLTEHLDVEVEPLDSLFSIDPSRLPEPPGEFRERAADFRLAWAAAADWPTPVNLLRERNRRAAKSILSRAVVAAGVATGVAFAWQLQRSDWWPAPAPPHAPVNARPAAAGVRPAAVSTSTRPPQPPAALAPPAPAPTIPAPEAVARARTPEPMPSPRPEGSVPVDARVQPRAPQPEPTAARRVPRSRDSQAAAQAPLPYDGVLGSILYSPDRQLAIVDGRIVQAGDEVNGARVVGITPTNVMLRDERGRLRQLGLSSGR
jgi:hypothetical protein